MAQAESETDGLLAEGGGGGGYETIKTARWWTPRFMRNESKSTRMRKSGTLDWPSLLVVYFIMLVSEAARGLVIPSQWPYLRALHGTKAQLGVFVASFSAGRMCATVPLGFLSDNLSMRAVFYVCSSLQILGHLIYCAAPNVPVLLFSRAVVGVGSATMSVCRAHVARATTRETRTTHFAYLSALQFIGFAVLPGAGGILAALPEFGLFGNLFVFNAFTYPGHLLILSNIIGIALLHWVYIDAPEQCNLAERIVIEVKDDTNGKDKSQKPPRPASPEVEASDEQPDWLALVACLLINICFRGVVAELETLASPLLMERYGTTVETTSYIIGGLGFLGLGVYFSFKPITRTFSDRQLVTIGEILIALGSIIAWQRFVPVPLWLFTLAIGLVWSLAYPLGQTAVLGLFSKILAGLPAGGFLGIFSAAGSLARVLFALFCAFLWSEAGPGAVFVQMLAASLATLVLTLLVYKRLVPYSRLPAVV
ncbi:Major facilitator superfamily domain-containing protein 8 [Porphyridium purpureum]|uniref:Major facilitator superfamily domain-containing protein 8 n=1 Tax=Porphyridium purpureum TaxID=35688 RepID=A0A5J4YYX7_PORPP|nr:Major facilitator superfamily domain-containing protein 8 [Porphyridium purpureum]|eukprot:POR4932..scf209_3